jgi:hypothetical protein
MGWRGRLAYIVKHSSEPKAFDQPYLITMGYKDGIPFVRYQLLPCYIHGHRVNLVSYYLRVNTVPPLRIWSGYFHCIHCKIMGSTETLRRYSCETSHTDAN